MGPRTYQGDVVDYNLGFLELIYHLTVHTGNTQIDFMYKYCPKEEVYACIKMLYEGRYIIMIQWLDSS